MMCKEGNRLIIVPVAQTNRLRELFTSEPLNEVLPVAADPPIEPEALF